MRNRVVALALGLAAAVTLLTAGTSLAATRCVGGGHGCAKTVQAALDAAHDGDVIKIAPGTYVGSLTVVKSVGIVGSGAGSTVIKGGGPVVTVGTVDAASEPTVSISAVKITGGRTTGAPFATGGGIF